MQSPSEQPEDGGRTSKKETPAREFSDTDTEVQAGDQTATPGRSKASSVEILLAIERTYRQRPFSRRSRDGRTGTLLGGAVREGRAGSISLKSARYGPKKYGSYGQVSGRRKHSRENILKSGKGFGFQVRQARARPSNTNDTGLAVG